VQVRAQAVVGDVRPQRHLPEQPVEQRDHLGAVEHGAKPPGRRPTIAGDVAPARPRYPLVSS
jgi:hypothetical protein